MKNLIKFLPIILIAQFSKAQDRVITTGVPFLLIAADARSAGLADMGVATSADAYSQQYNPSKYAFSKQKQAFSMSYTPYLTSIANDISLGQITYFNKIEDRMAFAASLRYFSLGEIELRKDATDPGVIVKPAEFSIDGSYSLKLSPEFSMGVAGRFISSNLRFPTEGANGAAAKSFAVDISGFYQSEEVAYENFNGKWRAGFNFQNLGPKINYELTKDDQGSNFLPSNLRLGGGFDFIFDDYNKVSVVGEVTKLLIPTPQTPAAPVDVNNDGDFNDSVDITEAEQNAASDFEYRKISWTDGIFKSFGDAPGGFSEELKEFTWALGAEYWYQDSFALRTGYFNESVEKGARKYLTLGAGFKYNIVKIDVSYLFSASKVRNPLENTLRFSLTFNFGDEYDDN